MRSARQRLVRRRPVCLPGPAKLMEQMSHVRSRLLPFGEEPPQPVGPLRAEQAEQAADFLVTARRPTSAGP